MAPQSPQEKGQLLAAAYLSQPHGTPFLLELSAPAILSHSHSLRPPLRPSALFHGLPQLLLLQEALPDSQAGLGVPWDPRS